MIDTTQHDNVNNPKHYTNHPSGIECIQVVEHMSFNLGNAVKYIWRFKDKNGLEDLKKARWYLDREIRNIEPDKNPIDMKSVMAEIGNGHALVELIIDHPAHGANEWELAKQWVVNRKSLPSYHELLDKLCSRFGVPGSQSFDSALDWIARHNALASRKSGQLLTTAIRNVATASKGQAAYWFTKLAEELEILERT